MNAKYDDLYNSIVNGQFKQFVRQFDELDSYESITFSDVRIGQGFKCNGNYCVKKSKRTAIITEFNKVSYYGKNEIVQINNQ